MEFLLSLIKPSKQQLRQRDSRMENSQQPRTSVLQKNILHKIREVTLLHLMMTSVLKAF